MMQFVVPVVTMAGMAVIVALVLAVVSNLLKVEGEARIRVKNDDNVLVLPIGANLFNSLKTAGYDLLGTCGGKGTCATCRVKPLEGFSRPTQAQMGPLSPKLRKEGWVLSCQVSAEKDLVIELFAPLVRSWPKVEKKEEAEEAAVPQPQLSPLAAKIREALPGFDCDACGYPICEEYAEAVASAKASFDLCLPGGRPVLEKVKKITEEASAAVVQQ